MILCEQLKEKGGDIMYVKFYNTDVDDMIYGSTVTVPSDR